MRREQRVGVMDIQLQRLVDVLAPTQGITYLGASRRQNVVHRVGAVLGHAQHTHVGKQKVHFRGRLATRSVLEDNPNSVNIELSAGFRNLFCWRDQPEAARGIILPRPESTWPNGPGVSKGPNI